MAPKNAGTTKVWIDSPRVSVPKQGHTDTRPDVHLYCGDVLEVLKESVADASVDLIVTSPPYADARKSSYGGIHPDDYVDWFLPRAAELQRVLKPSGSFILNIKEKVVDGERHPYVLELILALKREGWYWVEEYLWHKKNCSPGKWPNRFRDAWERCLHFTKEKRDWKMNQDAVRVPISDSSKKRLANPSANDSVRSVAATKSGFGRKVANWKGLDTVYPCNVLYMATECGNKNHSAAFPESLPEFFIKLFSDAGDIVLDPFAGSGTTLAVAQRLGRRYIGVEKLPEFIPVIENRLEKTAALETAAPWRTQEMKTASANLCLRGIAFPEARPAYEEFRERMLALAATELAA
jgi:site-specific DNA-methyltransferase (adenine-specific)/site-specific DNA-methyltransferase (cytosine-N4-specific)